MLMVSENYSHVYTIFAAFACVLVEHLRLNIKRSIVRNLPVHDVIVVTVYLYC